jgi:hypothetical protein
MQRHLDAHRRLLIMAYQRYVVADRALQAARLNAVSWFPEAPARGTMLIGDPGSRIRRLYERRDRALAHLTLAQRVLDEAQDRGRQRPGRKLYLIGIR